MKRGASGLSMLVGIDKPSGMSSHDVVNRMRGVFKEKRIGHTGTLDPLATGALAVCIGPATRLGSYLHADDKRYLFRMSFGSATDTDDCDGRVIRTGTVPDEAADPLFAEKFVAGLVGKHQQLPPAYSAIKVDGVRSYKAARKGEVIDLKPRPIEVYEARLQGIGEAVDGRSLEWDVEAKVSKGTYVRALARDIGNTLGCPAHITALRRTQSGSLDVLECHGLEQAGQLGEKAALDPVKLLGLRLAFLDDSQAGFVENGRPLGIRGMALFSYPSAVQAYAFDNCSAGIVETAEELADNELVSMVSDNKLKAIYRYNASKGSLSPDCIFSIGVSRGFDN